jgi:hypothetical protein
MPKVTLLGDSIRASGYGNVVPELLGEEYEVYQPNVNGRNAKYTLRCLFDYASQMAGSRIVHWNNGLWDICNLFGDGTFSTEDEYVTTMLRIADILLSRYDKVIFATTTPVSPQNIYNDNEDIQRFNALIVPKLQEKGVIINDLYTPVATDIEKYICEDLIHLSQAGVELCAGLVADAVRQAAKMLPTVTEERVLKEKETGAPV